ncbi:MAG: DUF2277 domain-containing protein [Myxococcaceae bacterium]|jgi:hypothetical protein|nr:DUF2277 domain-containing protein [Myxococcaceae bacterium]
MCRNIRRLHHFEPPATEEELHASALQFVRKVSGMTAPSKANEAAFNRAIERVMTATKRLFSELAVHGPPHTREEEARRAKVRGEKREAQLRARHGN